MADKIPKTVIESKTVEIFYERDTNPEPSNLYRNLVSGHHLPCVVMQDSGHLLQADFKKGPSQWDNSQARLVAQQYNGGLFTSESFSYAGFVSGLKSILQHWDPKGAYEKHDYLKKSIIAMQERLKQDDSDLFADLDAELPYFDSVTFNKKGLIGMIPLEKVKEISGYKQTVQMSVILGDANGREFSYDAFNFSEKSFEIQIFDNLMKETNYLMAARRGANKLGIRLSEADAGVTIEATTSKEDDGALKSSEYMIGNVCKFSEALSNWCTVKRAEKNQAEAKQIDCLVLTLEQTLLEAVRHQ